MKYRLTLLLIFLFLINVNSQIISGKILNKAGELVSNARIGIENTEIGDISNNDGTFKLNLDNINKNELLKVYINEYKPYHVRIDDFINSNHNIILDEKTIELKPVNVHSKKYKFKNFGTKNNSWAYCGYNTEKFPEKIFQEYAIKIKNKKRLKVNKINLHILSIDAKDTITIYFDLQNATDGFPDDLKSLSENTLQLNFTKNEIIDNKVSLDVSKQNIWTNEDFFVLFRINEDFKGKIYFGGNVFAFSKETFYRNYFGNWKKFSAGEPSINVDVKIEK